MAITIRLLCFWSMEFGNEPLLAHSNHFFLSHAQMGACGSGFVYGEQEQTPENSHRAASPAKEYPLQVPPYVGGSNAASR